MLETPPFEHRGNKATSDDTNDSGKRAWFAKNWRGEWRCKCNASSGSQMLAQQLRRANRVSCRWLPCRRHARRADKSTGGKSKGRECIAVVALSEHSKHKFVAAIDERKSRTASMPYSSVITRHRRTTSARCGMPGEVAQCKNPLRQDMTQRVLLFEPISKAT